MYFYLFNYYTGVNKLSIYLCYRIGYLILIKKRGRNSIKNMVVGGALKKNIVKPYG